MNKKEQIEELMKLVKKLSEKEQSGFWGFVKNIDIINAMIEESISEKSMSEEQIQECIRRAAETRDFTLFAIASYQKQKQEEKKERDKKNLVLNKEEKEVWGKKNKREEKM